MSLATRAQVAAEGRLWALLLRLAACAVGVALLLWLVEPVLYAALGRVARDLVAFATTPPRIEDVRWAGDQFAVSSPLYRGVMGVTAPWFAMAVGVPLTLAAGLPGAGSAAGAKRCLAVVVAALVVGAIALANNVLAGLVPTLARRGLHVLPAWQAQLHVTAQDGLWEFAMVLLPAALCLAVAYPLLPWEAPRAEPRPARPLVVLGVLAVALVAAIWLDRVASARLGRVDTAALLRDLEPYNPELGGFLLGVAEEELAAGHRDAARESLQLALRYPAYTLEAHAALERLRASEPEP